MSAVADDGKWSAIDCLRAHTSLFPLLLDVPSIAEKAVPCRPQSWLDPHARMGFSLGKRSAGWADRILPGR
jgi:hypothetical protein